MRRFRENLFGAGAGSFPAYPGNTTGINAHAVVLDVATGLGLAGLLAVALAWLFGLKEPLANPDPRVKRAIGAFLVVTLPVILSGFWFESTVLWAGLALFSKVDLLARVDNLSYEDLLGAATLRR